MSDLPVATLRPARRLSLAWIIPAIALLVVTWMGYRAWTERGFTITIHLAEAHGLKVGDHVRYRGTSVGDVRAIALSDDLDRLIVTARLNRNAANLARSGTRFWVVRPSVSLEGATGLDTLIGPRYLAVLPPGNPHSSPNAPPQRNFVAMEHPPLVESIHPDDLEIVLHAKQRGSLAPGMPVLYRQVRIGTVLSVGLTSDAGGVEARLHIQRPYVALIRQRTRFWDIGGYSARLGWGGLAVDVDSFQTFMTGAIAIATPPLADAGDVVRTGHRFTLADEPPRGWQEWEPLISIGNELLPHGRSLPHPLRARLSWSESRLIGRSSHVRRGWVLHTDGGLLGPGELLVPGEKALEGSAVLEVAGQLMPIQKPTWSVVSMALLPARLDEARWPLAMLRRADEPEDCIVVGDPSAPIPLAAARLTPDGDVWRLDAAVAFDEGWHGAAVISRRDGALLGLLLVNGASARIELLPERLAD